jgi:hypothetical protein
MALFGLTIAYNCGKPFDSFRNTYLARPKCPDYGRSCRGHGLQASFVIRLLVPIKHRQPFQQAI